MVYAKWFWHCISTNLRHSTWFDSESKETPLRFEKKVFHFIRLTHVWKILPITLSEQFEPNKNRLHYEFGGRGCSCSRAPCARSLAQMNRIEWVTWCSWSLLYRLCAKRHTPWKWNSGRMNISVNCSPYNFSGLNLNFAGTFHGKGEGNIMWSVEPLFAPWSKNCPSFCPVNENISWMSFFFGFFWKSQNKGFDTLSLYFYDSL